MKRHLAHCLLILPVVSLGCTEELEYDRGQACVSAQELDGQLHLVVEANSEDCAADHKGATFDCSVTLDGNVAHIETEYRPGKDPNDACAGPIVTTCQVPIDPGSYTVEFQAESYPIAAPNFDPFCLPGGGSFEADG